MKVLLKFRVKLALIGALALLYTAVFASAGIDGVTTSLKADDLAIVAAGEVVYQSQCAACHGQYLEGQSDWRSRDENGLLRAPPHDATGHTWHHADDLLFELTKYGPGAVLRDGTYKTVMPAFEATLTDEQIIAVLSFIKNTWPEQERSWQDETNGPVESILQTPSKDKSFLDLLKKK